MEDLLAILEPVQRRVPERFRITPALLQNVVVPLYVAAANACLAYEQSVLRIGLDFIGPRRVGIKHLGVTLRHRDTRWFAELDLGCGMSTGLSWLTVDEENFSLLWGTPMPLRTEDGQEIPDIPDRIATAQWWDGDVHVLSRLLPRDYSKHT